MNLSQCKILVTGGYGFIGSYLLKQLTEEYGVAPKNIFAPNQSSCNLLQIEDCRKAVKGMDVVIHLAAKVGGSSTHASEPGALFYDNTLMSLQLLECARMAGVKKFINIGSIACYPSSARAPFEENSILNGLPIGHQAPYAFSKLAGLIQSQSYRDQYDFNSIFIILPNLYGPPLHDSQSIKSYVIPTFTRIIAEAQANNAPIVHLQGNPHSAREFMHVSDASNGIINATISYNNHEPINIGSGDVIKIGDLAKKIANTLNYKGAINFRGDNSAHTADIKSLDLSKAKKELKFKADTMFDKEIKKTVSVYSHLI